MSSISPTSRPGYVYDSATDTWIPIGIGPHTHAATDISGVVDDSLIDARGDLIVGTAADTPGRLAVGANGETLVADSSASTGLRWQGSMAAGRNFASNGGFDIWQRGTSFATPAVGAYVADRFSCLNTNTGTTPTTVSRQNTSDSTNLPFLQYCLRYQRNSGATGTGTVYLTQSLETVNSIPLAGRTVTFSFYARRGANYSSSSNLLLGELNSGTGTDQNINSSFTGNTQVAAISAALTTTWQRFSFTGTVPSTSTQLGFYFYYTPTGTAGAADFFEVTGVQLEVGSVATQFTRQGGTLAGELAACQRYYWRSSGQAYCPVSTGMNVETTDSYFYVNHPVPMRTSPTTVDYSTLEVTDLYAYNTAVTNLVITSNSSGRNVTQVQATHGANGTRYRVAFLRNAFNTAGYIGFSAEL